MRIKKLVIYTGVAAILIAAATLGAMRLLYARDTNFARPPAEAPTSLVIENITVIDVVGSRQIPNQSVFVSDGRIEEIQPSMGANVQPQYFRIDGSEKYLIPGIWDMHVHLGPSRARVAHSMPLLIANGVTSVRDMMSDCRPRCSSDDLQLDQLHELARDIEAGSILGPRIRSLSSFLVHGPTNRGEMPIDWPEFATPGISADGRKLVRYLADLNVSFIKTYNSIPRDAYFGLMMEAGRLGMTVGGHVPRSISVGEAAAAGHRSVEHARALVYSCSRYGKDYRAQMEMAAAGQLEGRAVDDSLTRLTNTIATQEPGLCDAAISSMVEHGTYYVPTHVTRRMDAFANDPEYRDDPNLTYVPTSQLRYQWLPDIDSYATKPVEFQSRYMDFYRLGLELTGRAHRAGVKVLLGTDANDTYITPGFSAHSEMYELHAAGLSEMDVLRAATIIPAEYSGMAHLTGSIDVGKAADMVVLGANPLQDINHTRHIDGLIFDGRYYSRDELDEWLYDAQRRAHSMSSYWPVFLSLLGQ